VAIDLVNSPLTVTGPHPVDPAALSAAVDEAGYQLMAPSLH
jgi:hypothetical protein